MSEQFVHCHAHSQYSLIDGRVTIERYIDACEKDGQPAFALTDHGSISGAIDLYTTARKHGVKPIIGSEIYIDHLDADAPRPSSVDHLTILAKSERGYRDLVLATTMAAANFYYRPRLYFSEIAQNNLWSDWFILSGCKSSTLSKLLLAGEREQAFNFADYYAKHAGGFALEVMPQDTSRELLEQIKILSKVTGIPMVLTNDCHYGDPSSEDLYQNLIANGDKVRGIEFDGRGFHWRSTREMFEIAEQLGVLDAARNTVKVAEACNVTLPEVDDVVWDAPQISKDPKKDISVVCEIKLPWLSDAHTRRYNYEMSVLARVPHVMQSYLVAFDIVNWCRNENIPARCRGSMGGSLVAWLMGITYDDPVVWNLKFERAVNPARPTIPDFDIDVSSLRRDEVLNYILHKWPNAKPIVTFQTYKPHGAIKQVMRAYNFHSYIMDGVTKNMPDEWGDHIDWNPVPPELVETIKTYDGLFNTMSIHPAGISLNTPSTMIPLTWIVSSKQFVAGFDMYSLKKIGNFKMDILGLKTLDQIQFFEETTGVKAPEKYEDEAVFEKLSTGKTAAIFQLDGYAAGNCISAIGGINKFEDIVACNALARPGAIKFADVYRTGDTPYIAQYPPLAPVLTYSNGVVLYQEQAMEIARILANFDDIEQDEIKEATKNFRENVFNTIGPKFLERCRTNGWDGQAIWDAIKQFSGYAFNRAHAVAYAAVAYQLAWFKTHYPTHFYAGVFDKYKDPMRLVIESYSFGVRWKLPDINESGYYTTVEKDNQGDYVQLGIGTIKGIGEAVAAEILQKRPFASVEDFEDRIDKKKCNVGYKRRLYSSGCFEALGVRADKDGLRELLGINACAFRLDEFLAAIPRSLEYDVLAGFVASIKPTKIKKEGRNFGREMGIVTVMNSKGSYMASLFPSQWMKFKTIVRPGDAVWFKGERDGKFFRVEQSGIVT